MFGFPLEVTLTRSLIIHIQFKAASNHQRNQKLRAICYRKRLSKTKVQFVLRYTKGGVSSTESSTI